MKPNVGLLLNSRPRLGYVRDSNHGNVRGSNHGNGNHNNLTIVEEEKAITTTSAK